MAAASASTMFLLIYVYSLVGEALGTILHPGNSLSTTTELSWSSNSGHFAFGFYKQGSGFFVGTWLIGKEKSIMVWTAYRDYPLITSYATLSLTNEGIVLNTWIGDELWIALPSGNISYAYMLDTGSFVLYDRSDNIVWNSFDYPTNTLLGDQILLPGGHLYSSQSETDPSTGRFHLDMQTDGNLVLYPSHTANSPEDSYWSSSTVGSNATYLFLNSSSQLVLINGASSSLIHVIYYNNSKSSDGFKYIYRATLDVDGVFRLYSHSPDETGKLTTETLWQALDDSCEVKGFCGFNSYCTFDDTKPYCHCLHGTDFLNPDQPSLGCKKNSFGETWLCKNENTGNCNITEMDHMRWGDHPYFQAQMTIEECKASCLEDWNCGAALFLNDNCMKQSLPLRYIRRIDTETSKALVKMVNKPIGEPNFSDPIAKKQKVAATASNPMWVLIVIVLSSIFSALFLTIAGIFIYKCRVLEYQRLLESGNSGFVEDLKLRLFSYNDLRKATNGFREELGKGSFGAVYKGSFHKGKKLVAVKRLEKVVEEGEREFQAEMRTIGRAHHKNLVRLLGYCIEDSKRLLVYDYMPNGSLANLVFRSDNCPDWNERVRIAEEVAKGILYLHEECETPIIHCDIKPQNILMDDFWTVKISDFGLAKLLMPDQTRTYTSPRGTRGYSAPEWAKTIPISLKVDVYSYGIVLLEIICRRRIFEVNVSDPEKILLTAWVYKCFVKGQLNKIVNGEEVPKNSLDKMVKIALWCIQDEPVLRPSMKSVVLMLEGITDISIPLCPTGS